MSIATPKGEATTRAIAGPPRIRVTVIATQGPDLPAVGTEIPLEIGAPLHPSLGRAELDASVRKMAKAVAATGQPRTATLSIAPGREARVLIEPDLALPTLVVLGGGPIANAVGHLGGELGFELVVLDDREAQPNEAPVTPTRRVIRGLAPSHLEQIPYGPNCYILLATRDPLVDQELLAGLLNQTYRFLGVLGSHQKAGQHRRFLHRAGFPAELIARMVCPVGLDIQAQTTTEIALSICAQLVAVRRGRPPETVG